MALDLLRGQRSDGASPAFLGVSTWHRDTSGRKGADKSRAMRNVCPPSPPHVLAEACDGGQLNFRLPVRVKKDWSRPSCDPMIRRRNLRGMP